MTTRISTTEATAEDYVRRGLAHVWIHYAQYADLAQPEGLLVLVKGEGVYLTDIKGRRYLDGLAGLAVVAVGHGREELARVAYEQMREFAYVNTFQYTTKPAVDLATKLAELAPGSINRIFFVNSGSEAVEMAIRIAKQHHFNRGDRKRYKVISRIGSYHGQTAGALSVNGATYAYRVPAEPLVPGSIHVQGVNCYRCPYEKTYPDCNVFCARVIEQHILFERPETVACLIAEPISASNGAYVPPPEYWPTLRALCDRYGIVLIADEVITGFGRTGKWWGIQHFDVQPDVMTIGKGFSSGYLPISAAMVKDEIAQEFVGDASRTFYGGITFGTHPVSCAVALANIEIIEREGLVENSAAMGDYLLGELTRLMDRHSVIGDVRGKGLLAQAELVKDRESRAAFAPDDPFPRQLQRALRERGLLCRVAFSRIELAPPLCIKRAEIDEMLGIIADALAAASSEVSLVAANEAIQEDRRTDP